MPARLLTKSLRCSKANGTIGAWSTSAWSIVRHAAAAAPGSVLCSASATVISWSMSRSQKKDRLKAAAKSQRAARAEPVGQVPFLRRGVARPAGLRVRPAQLRPPASSVFLRDDPGDAGTPSRGEGGQPGAGGVEKDVVIGGHPVQPQHLLGGLDQRRQREEGDGFVSVDPVVRAWTADDYAESGMGCGGWARSLIPASWGRAWGRRRSPGNRGRSRRCAARSATTR